MRIIFTTDLHGCAWKYDKLCRVAQDFEADVVINSGDMLPKNIDLFQQDKFITRHLRARAKITSGFCPWIASDSIATIERNRRRIYRYGEDFAIEERLKMA